MKRKGKGKQITCSISLTPIFSKKIPDPAEPLRECSMRIGSKDENRLVIEEISSRGKDPLG